MSEPRRLKPAPPDPSREMLRKAIAERDGAQDALVRAQDAARAGLDLLAAAEKKLAAFGDLDAAIVQIRAKRIKDAAKGGPAADLKLPDELVERRMARDEAREHVLANKVAHTSLAADVDQAQKALGRAEGAVAEAAAAIIQEEAIKQASALRAAWSSVWQLTDVLNALRGVPTSLPLPPDTIWLLNLIAGFDHRQFAGGRNAALGLAGERWRAWSATLSKDADAPKPEFIDDGGSSAVRAA